MLDDAGDDTAPTTTEDPSSDRSVADPSDYHPTERRPTSGERLHERLRAVERAITDGDRSLPEACDAVAPERMDEFDDRLADIEERVAELEAATQALRGYVGSIRAVNREVERRADLALATATEARDGEETPSNADLADRGDRPCEEPAVAAAVPDGRGVHATVDDVRKAIDTATEWSDSTEGTDGSVAAGDDHSVDDGDAADVNSRVTDGPTGDGAPDSDGDSDVISRLREVL